MIELLAVAITLKWWMLLAAITIFTGIIAYIMTEEPGGYFSIPDILPFLCWAFGNLIMWLIYFIVV